MNLDLSSSSTRTLKNTNLDLNIRTCAQIFQHFLALSCQPNTKIQTRTDSSKNTNTNPATNFPCQPNTKQQTQTQTSARIQTQIQQQIFLVNQTQKQQTQTQTSSRIQTQTQQFIFRKPAIHLQKTQKTQIQTQTQIRPHPSLELVDHQATTFLYSQPPTTHN